jgi:EF hand/EF-hand domain
MLFALGAASAVWDALQSLTSASKPSSVQTESQQTTSNAFDLDAGGATVSGGAASGTGTSGGLQISPQTMSALIAAQSQSAASGTAPTDPPQALQDLFSRIDTNGDGAITKQEFEQALGAGGTNIAAADDVFNKLDTNGDGTVRLDELKSALQGAGHHGHHHMHAGGAGDANGAGDTGCSSSDPLLAALAGASETSVTNGDGSTTTSITYTDGSTVSLTTPAVSSTSQASSSATSSYNLIEQLIQREAQALSASTSGGVSLSA